MDNSRRDEPQMLNLFTLCDFEHIKDVVTKEIASKLSAKLWKNDYPSSNFEKNLKKSADEFAEDVFQGLESNLLIDGLTLRMARSKNEEYEPRSLELIDTLEEAHKKRSELISELMAHRRNIPEDVCKYYSAQLEPVSRAIVDSLSEHKHDDIDTPNITDSDRTERILVTINEFNELSEDFIRTGIKLRDNILSENERLREATTLISDNNVF